MPGPGPRLPTPPRPCWRSSHPPRPSLLENLVDHNLLFSHAPGRYRLHDLIRAHARVLAATDPAPERAAALDRLLSYYAHTAHSASTFVIRCARPAPVGPAPARTPVLPGPEAARAWLRTERENIDARHYATASRSRTSTPSR